MRVLSLINEQESIDEIIRTNRALAPDPIVPLYLIIMGLHDRLTDKGVGHFAVRGGSAIDLGKAGSAAAVRLRGPHRCFRRVSPLRRGLRK